MSLRRTSAVKQESVRRYTPRVDDGTQDTMRADTQVHPGRPAPLSAGTRVGRYEVVAPIGAGGMGIVALANDPELLRKVVLKLVRPELGSSESDGAARLLREAQAMARVSHPHVVPIYDVGTHEGQVFLAMEFVDGVDLARWLDAKPRTLPEILAVFAAAGRGLAAAHAASLVHRDFKPANVLLGRTGEVKVSDFGLAAPRRAAGAALPKSLEGFDDLTLTGTVMGTPAYMPPEQLMGETVDHRADQFAFCVALWHALYGVRPFAGAHNVPSLVEAITRGQPQKAKTAKAVGGARLEAALRRGLAAKASDRWPDMPTLLAELTPKSRALPIAAGAAVVIAGAVVAFAVVHGRGAASSPAERCAADPLADIWSPGLAAKLDPKVAAGIDAYAASWRAAQRDVCVVAETYGIPQEPERAACLDRARRELAKTIEAHPDTTAVAGLRSLFACGDPSPQDLELMTKVARVRAALGHADLAIWTNLDLAQGEAGEALRDARALAYPPVEAEALLMVGRVAMERAKWEEAAASLTEAIQVADLGHHDRVKGEAQLALIPVFRALGRPDEAERYATYAMASLHDAGSLARAELATAQALAKSFEHQGMLDEALAQRTRAVEVAEQLGSHTRELALALVEEARGLSYVHRFEDELPLLDRAEEIARALPPPSFDIEIGAGTLRIDALSALGRADDAIAVGDALAAKWPLPELQVQVARLYVLRGAAGDGDKAIAMADRAMADNDTGLRHASMLAMKAVLENDLGRLPDAERDIRQALDGLEAAGAPAEQVLTVRNALGVILTRAWKLDDAIRILDQDAKVLEVASDPDRLLMAGTFLRLGEALVRDKQMDRAREVVARARKAVAPRNLRPADEAAADWIGARASSDVELAKAARTLYAAAGDTKKAAEIDAWLSGLRR